LRSLNFMWMWFWRWRFVKKTAIFSKKVSHRYVIQFLSSHVFNFILLINLDIDIVVNFFDKVGEVILCMYKSSCQHITLERNLKISPMSWLRSVSHCIVEVRVRSRTSASGICFIQTVRETRSFLYGLCSPSMLHSFKFRILIKCTIWSYYLTSSWNTTLCSHCKTKLRLILKPALKFIAEICFLFII